MSQTPSAEVPSILLVLPLCPAGAGWDDDVFMPCTELCLSGPSNRFSAKTKVGSDQIGAVGIMPALKDPTKAEKIWENQKSWSSQRFSPALRHDPNAGAH